MSGSDVFDSKLRGLCSEICFSFSVRFSRAKNSFHLYVARGGAHRAHDIDVTRAHAEIAG
jgi:hypothetical protein